MVDLPLGGDGHIPGRHGGGNGLIPAGKGVACFGRVGRGGNGRAVVLLNDDILPAVFRLKGDGVLVDLPLCRQGQIGGHGIGKVPFAFAVVPADEGIALFSGVGRLVGRGVGTNLGWGGAFAIGQESDRTSPHDLSGDLGAGGLRKPATRRDKHAVGRLAFLLPGHAAGNGPGGHLEPAAIFHINTAALARRTTHDIAAPHEEGAAGRHIDTAAGVVAAAGDGAALYLDDIFTLGILCRQLPQGAALIKLVNSIGIAVDQRQLAISHDMDQVAAPAGCFQQVAVQINGHRSIHCPIGGDLNIPNQADDRGIGNQRFAQFFRGGHFQKSGQLQGAFLLDIIVRQSAAVLQKSAAKIQAFPIYRNTRVLDLLLDIIDAVAAFHLQGQRFLPAQGAAIHITWHGMGGGEQHGQGQQDG